MPKQQANIHIFFEFLAIFFVAPYLLFMSTKIPQPHRFLFILISIMTIIIDGYLLCKWFNGK